MGHRRLVFWTFIVIAAFGRAAAQAPPEVTNLMWCSGSKACLQWDAAAGATNYKVYSGRISTMPGLLNVTNDSCLSLTPATPTTGPALTDTPPPCSLFWYLVDAVNASGEGTVGNATAGPRLLNSSGSCGTCASTGSACTDDDSCCSGRCFGGTCQDACCAAAGSSCGTGPDCCSGICTAGICATTPTCPYGQAACNGACATPSCSSQGVCAGQTIPVYCKDRTTLSCNYSAVPNVEVDGNGNLLPQEHRCDGLDGNCNGVVDLDGFSGLGQACGAGNGVCRTQGTVVCTSPTTAGCNATPNPAAAVDELCDGLDNDCDGVVDERTPPPGLICNNGGPHACVGYKDPMVAVTTPLTVYVYQYEASHPDATAGSTGASTARACSKPGVLPWSAVSETQAAAACAAIRDSANQPMRLCTAAEWQSACEGPTGPAASKWSESVTPATYVSGVCNDWNRAGCQVWPTGSNGSSPTNFCYTDWGAAGKLHDLSGNLGEWTSSTVTYNGTTYYRLRGGSYGSGNAGTTCETDVRWGLATFSSPDVGFRCCSDNAP
ncbi:MAG TPA: SUMF1/EgtB/PvdO family nonheme iron enzyme [Candidatus Polarisedimenticolaceae bacterium]|nr:SUMF1/EgtB/PvdO family nonheme iron enzyme [Candidatus Polarisedimenticolaceae bacterium]